MAATLKVQEAAGKKLLKELGKKGDKLAGPKLAKALMALVEDEFDDDDLESLSKGSTKLLQKIADAKKIEVQGSDDDEDDEDEKPAKKGKKASKDKDEKKAKPKKDGEVSKKTQQGHAINDVLERAKGPLSLEEIHKKASKVIDMSETRVKSHLDYLVDTKETVKKNKNGYALVSE